MSRAGAELREKCGVGKITVQQANEMRALTPSDPDAERLYAEGLAKLRSFESLAGRDSEDLLSKKYSPILTAQFRRLNIQFETPEPSTR